LLRVTPRPSDAVHQVCQNRSGASGGRSLSLSEERTLDRIPTFDTNREQTRETRRKTEEFLKASGATMWIQHDMALHEKLKKAPDYIE
jgi:hypothetical protein